MKFTKNQLSKCHTKLWALNKNRDGDNGANRKEERIRKMNYFSFENESICGKFQWFFMIFKIFWMEINLKLSVMIHYIWNSAEQDIISNFFCWCIIISSVCSPTNVLAFFSRQFRYVLTINRLADKKFDSCAYVWLFIRIINYKSIQ